MNNWLSKTRNVVNENLKNKWFVKTFIFSWNLIKNNIYVWSLAGLLIISQSLILLILHLTNTNLINNSLYISLLPQIVLILLNIVLINRLFSESKYNSLDWTLISLPIGKARIFVARFILIFAIGFLALFAQFILNFIICLSTQINSKIKIKDGIYGALNAYNNNILSLNNVEYSTYANYVNGHANNNNVISANDILVLKEYDEGNDLVKNQEAIYGKYLRGYSFSETLFNPSFASKTINDNKLVLNAITEDELRQKMMYALPSKITIIFDISGKIRNPGVNSDGIIDTSNPAIYDSEQNVINNLMWTTVVEKDPHKSFYREDDGTYTLIDNTVNAIYPLYWNGKTNYFASYEDAEAYLLELIKLEAIKVLI